MKTILVTGGAGFIGSHVIGAILSKGDARVVCVDDLSSAKAAGFADEREYVRPFEASASFVFHACDIRDKGRMMEIFTTERPDIVIHLAARADTRRAVEEPHEYLSVNVDGTLTVLECARRSDVRSFVFASSSSVYGNGCTAPFREDARTDFPLSPYGASKKAGEVLAYTYHHNFGMNIAVMRIFNAYGERMRSNLVLYKWVKNMFADAPIELSGEGTRRRDFTYVGDLADALLRASDIVGYEIVNVGNAEPVSLAELLRITEEATGLTARVVKRESHHASVEETHADVSKAAELMGWRPTTSLSDGVARFVAWFRSQRA